MDNGKIVLRGHHLWNLHSSLLDILRQEDWGRIPKNSLLDKAWQEYYCEEKDDGAHGRLDYILYKIANNPEIIVKIADNQDDACRLCTNKRDGICEVDRFNGSEDVLKQRDHEVAAFYGFECGKDYNSKEIFKTLRKAKKIQVVDYWNGPVRIVNVKKFFDQF